MLDLKIRDILNALKTNCVIRLDWSDTGESFYPSVGDIVRYSEFYVTGLSARNNELTITMKQEI